MHVLTKIIAGIVLAASGYLFANMWVILGEIRDELRSIRLYGMAQTRIQDFNVDIDEQEL